MHPNRPLPYVLATPKHRLGGRVVDSGLYIVTFGIGWLIWNLIDWTDGRTPGHQVVKMRVYSMDTGRPASWGHMALRQFVLPVAYSIVPLFIIIMGAAIDSNGSTGGVGLVGLGYLALILIWLVDVFWIFKGDKRQRLVDVFAKTAVLNECVEEG